MKTRVILICKECKEPLCECDEGYYCSNQSCESYDKDIMAFEDIELMKDYMI